MRRFPITLLALLAVACGPSMPTESEAESWYAGSRERVDAFEGALRSALNDVPAFGIAEIPCERTERPEPLGDAQLGGLVDAANCTAQRREVLERRDAAVARLGDEGLRRLVEEAGGMSVVVTYRMPDHPLRFHLGHVEPAPPGYKEGTVRAEDGATVDGRKLGWGLYSTRWTRDGETHGDDDYHRGFEVQWSFDVNEAAVEVDLFFLADEGND